MAKWVGDGGIFGDLVKDDYAKVAGLVNTGDDRLKIPRWQDKRYGAPCQVSCPSHIPTQDRIKLLRQGKVEEALALVLHYSPFPGSVCGEVCPNLCMDSCTRRFLDHPVRMKELGRLSVHTPSPQPAADSGKKVAVIGGGPGGLSAAWQLRLQGHAVTVFEADTEVGGKLRQVIPTERLPEDALGSEIDRIKSLGIDIRTGTRVDAPLFAQIRGEFDAVAIASGAHNPVVIPFPGHERLVKGLDFLKAINRGERPAVGERVVVLGAGNAGMDVCLGAYAMGAKRVTAIDIQRPAAYANEIAHVEKLGGQIRWPVFTAKVDQYGVHTKSGELLEADTVIIAIGERPDLSFVPRAWLTDRGMMDGRRLPAVAPCAGGLRHRRHRPAGAVDPCHRPGSRCGRADRCLPRRPGAGTDQASRGDPGQLPVERAVPAAEPWALLLHRRPGRDRPLPLLRHLPRLLHVPGGLPGGGDPPPGKGGRQLRVRLRRPRLHRLRDLFRDLPLRHLGDGPARLSGQVPIEQAKRAEPATVPPFCVIDKQLPVAEPPSFHRGGVVLHQRDHAPDRGSRGLP